MSLDQHGEMLRRLNSWSQGVPAPPWKLQIRMVPVCNLKCFYCGYSNEGHLAHLSRIYPKRLPTEFYLRVLREAAAMGVRYVQLLGDGEVLAYKDQARAVLQEVKRQGMTGWLVTNGTLFDEGLIRMLVDDGFDEIKISLDAPSPDIHDRMRGVPGTFDRIVRAIDRFRFWKEELGSLSPRLGLHTVLTRMNRETLSRLIRFASEHGIEDITFLPLSDITQACAAQRLSAEQWESLRHDAPQLVREATSCGVVTNLSSLVAGSPEYFFNQVDHLLTPEERGFRSIACFQPFLMMGVTPDGFVSPCPLMEKGGEAAAPLLDDSLEHAWSGSVFTEVRRRMLEHNLFGKCKTCCASIFLENAGLKEELSRAGPVAAVGVTG